MATIASETGATSSICVRSTVPTRSSSPDACEQAARRSAAARAERGPASGGSGASISSAGLRPGSRRAGAGASAFTPPARVRGAWCHRPAAAAYNAPQEDPPVLSRLDDYPIHQTPEPIAHPASSDRNVYDRYWFNGYAEDGEFYFGIGAAVYPNRGILDCGFSIVRDGEQHAFHASRRLPKEPAQVEVGPFRIDVTDPMRRLRVVLAPNETGIECDLAFAARTAAIQEGRQTLRRGERLVMDVTRFAQFGRWQGRIRYGGRELRIEAARVYGTKDRSWGIRPVGEPETGGAPQAVAPHVFFLWSPIHWKDRCTHYGIFEDADGFVWHQDAAIRSEERRVGK